MTFLEELEAPNGRRFSIRERVYVPTELYLMLYSNVHADFSSALIFVLGGDSFKLRHGAQYQVYIGTDKPISLSVIKQKGEKFWEMLDKGKTAYEAMESIQPSWWERYIEGKASFELDGDKNWRLGSG